MSNIAHYHLVSPDKLRRHYKKQSSGFTEWEQKEHAEDYLLFPENVAAFLSIDEVSLSQGELYTFVTSKESKGKRGTLVASIKGTKALSIIEVLQKIPLQVRQQVKEVTLDMAKNMESAVRQAFPKCSLVTDRFHVVKLAGDALQHLRIKHRWEELEKENQAIKAAKKEGRKYLSKTYNNGDTPKQLLARSRYILAKKQSKWTASQQDRAAILFDNFSDLEDAYNHTMQLRNIYEKKDKDEAKTAFQKWINKTSQMQGNTFQTVANTIEYNMENILNFFNFRNTNANAESFNARVKLFRANLRGVSDTAFFLFRLQKIFA